MTKRTPRSSDVNEVTAKLIKNQIRAVGQYHDKEGANLKQSIKSMAEMYARAKGVEAHKNPNDKRS